ncbi:MAG: flagellar hook-basal body complex protein FliE [Mariniblastus sp.]
MKTTPPTSAISQLNLKATPHSKTESSGVGGFAELVDGFVKQTNETQIKSDDAIADLLSGKTDNVQHVVMSVANAEMSFQLFMEIRNKLIDSYNELMRMQF